MLNKHCPHCQKQITRGDLIKLNAQKDYISRKTVNCPHCEQLIQLPPLAEKLISIGLLLSVIFAPLNVYWFNGITSNSGLNSEFNYGPNSVFISGLIFGLGVLLIIIGVIKNQPQAVRSTNDQ